MPNPPASDTDRETDPDGAGLLAVGPDRAQACTAPIVSLPVDAKHPTPAAFLPPGPWMPNPFHPVRHLMLESTQDVREAIDKFRRTR